MLYDSLHQTPQYVDDGYPMIRVTDIRRGFVETKGAVRVDEETYLQFSKKHKPQVGDILFSRVGSYGNSAYVNRNEEFCLGQNTVCISPEHSRIQPNFLYFALNSDDLRNQIESLVGGASQGTISLKNIRKLQVPLPPLPEQRLIAGILSAYDELIENNQQRIRILEEMARSLYREWFVHFRYPGHESVLLVDSPLGQIPQGWEVKALGELMLEQIGGGWGKDVPDEKHTEPAWVIRGTDIPDARSCQVADVPHRFHSVSNLRSRRLQAGNIIFEVSGGSKGQPVGRTLLVTPQLLSALGDEAVICASFCKRICPDMPGYGSELLYLSFLEGYESGEIEQFQVQSTGISNFKWTEYLEKITRVISPESVRMRFRDLVKPMLSQAATLGLQTANLRRTRDLLLPRLLSGQVVLNSNIKEELT